MGYGTNLAQCVGARKPGGCVGRYQGVIIAALSGVALVLTGSLIKHFQNFHVAELSLYITLFSSIYSLPIVCLNVKEIKPDRKTIGMWALLSIVTAVIGVTRTAAFQMLPLGDSSAIIFSTPIFTALFSRVVLKEHISRMTIISLVLSLLGMILIVKLPLMIYTGDISTRLVTSRHFIGCGLAFAAVMTTACHYIILRTLRGSPPALNTFISNLGTAVIFVGLTPAYGGFHQPPCNTDSLLLIIMGTSQFLFFIMGAKALQKDDPTTVTTVIRSTDIVVSFIVQMTIFSESADAFSISGAFVIFACGLMMPLQRWMEGLTDRSPFKLNWLLK